MWTELACGSPVYYGLGEKIREMATVNVVKKSLNPIPNKQMHPWFFTLAYRYKNLTPLHYEKLSLMWTELACGSPVYYGLGEKIREMATVNVATVVYARWDLQTWFLVVLLTS